MKQLSRWILLAVLSIVIGCASPIFAFQNHGNQSTIAGDAWDFVPESGTNQVTAVLQTEPNEQGIISFVVQNGTDHDVDKIKAVATIRDASGNLLAVIDEDAKSNIQPQHIQAGEYALGYIRIGEITRYDPFPDGATFELAFAPLAEVVDWPEPLFRLSNFDRDGDVFTGDIAIDIDQNMYMFFPMVACFSDDGEFMYTLLTYVSHDLHVGMNKDIALEFSDGVGDCNRFLIAAGETM